MIYEIKLVQSKVDSDDEVAGALWESRETIIWSAAILKKIISMQRLSKVSLVS